MIMPKTTKSTLDKPQKPPKNAKKGDIHIVENKKGRTITMKAEPKKVPNWKIVSNKKTDKTPPAMKKSAPKNPRKGQKHTVITKKGREVTMVANPKKVVKWTIIKNEATKKKGTSGSRSRSKGK